MLSLSEIEEKEVKLVQVEGKHIIQRHKNNWKVRCVLKKVINSALPDGLWSKHPSVLKLY